MNKNETREEYNARMREYNALRMEEANKRSKAALDGLTKAIAEALYGGKYN